jgi:pimeloyl-ACP methyl ester carboxylesterase
MSMAVLPMPAVAGVEHRFVQIGDGTSIHVAEAGAGPPLVLLHGWPQHWWSWRELIGPLAEHYRVLCPDIRGCGWSGGADGSFRFDDLAEDLFGLLDALGIDRVRLVGHDWGLFIGYRACLLRPERFERFVPLAGVHPWQGRDTSPAGFTHPWHVYVIATLGAAAVTRLGLGERALRRWRHAGAFTEDECAIYIGPVRRSSSVTAAVRFDRRLVFREIPRALRAFRSWRLPVPTLHLIGAHDPLTPCVPDSYRPYTDDMTVAVIPDCGHFIPEEAPARLLERLTRFL